MPRMQMTSIEELAMRSARPYLYGPPFAWEASADRYRAGRAPKPSRRRLSDARAAFGRARGGRPVAAEAGGCG